MKKKVLLCGLLTVAMGVTVGAVVLSASPESFALADAPQAEWHHYSKRNPTASSKGIREYWVMCGGSYQFEEPSSGTIVDKGSAYDESEFADNDNRYFSYKYDEDNLGFDYYNYGARMYCVSTSDYKDWRATYEHNAANFNLYSDGGNVYTWKIELPRIDYTRYPLVTMKVTAPNWYENNMMGPELDQLTYHTKYGGNKGNGKINLTLKSTGLHMEFIDIEYGTAVAFTNDFTDANIINGLSSAYFYTTDLYDRYLNISDVTLATEVPAEDIYSYAGDTSKLSVEYGTVGLPSKVEWSIIGNNYATDDTGLAVSGNGNPNYAIVSLPAINFNQHLITGSVSFKFGVKNNNEQMFFGSGDGRVSLGSNSPSSQSDNNNGYVNWEMVISSAGAYVHNVYQAKNYEVQLTAGMLAGTERIVLSGGGASVYRVYLFTDFYWKA